MQSVSNAFTAEEFSLARKIAQNVRISWKKDSILGNRTFTIGVSIIGGNDIIGINPGAIGSPGNYRYFDESDYVTALAWENGFNIPLGGLSKSLAEVYLDNTTQRFTPDYAGGNSELFTSILPRRPIIINAGFDINGVEEVIPQFAGVVTRQPSLNRKRAQIKLMAADYVDFFENRFLDKEVMFTGQRTDQVFQSLFEGLGMSTAQYDLDEGLNTIPFGLFDKGTRYRDIINQLAQAEGGHVYQDEEGIFRFENRQHWYSSPHNQVQRVLPTAQVIEIETPDDDHIINVVEIKSTIREKQPLQTIYTQPSLTTLEIPPSSSIERFFEFQDPVLALTDPSNGGADSYFVANNAEDGSGTDLTSSITFTNLGTFAKAVKYRISNASASTAYVTQLVLAGRVAKTTGELYYRDSLSESVTAYEERVLTIENDYIQNISWARSYAQLLFSDYADPEALQKVTILAIPELQKGDLLSWQGTNWRVFDIKNTLSPSVGYVQELTMLKRSIEMYFTIGVSTIGGTDIIAP